MAWLWLLATAHAGVVEHDVRAFRFAGGHRIVAEPVVDGRPVHGGRQVVSLDLEGRVRRADGPEVPEAGWPSALIATGEALDVAAAAAPWLGQGELWAPRASEGWLLRDGELVPVRIVDLSTAAPPATWRLYVDARDGRTVRLDRTSSDAEGHVYPTHPIDSEPARVQLPRLLSDTELLGEYAYAASCVEWTVSESLFGVTSCDDLDRQARPDAGGNYLFEPSPAGDPDPLAEVHTYFHVDRIAAWADERFGLRLPYGPVRATVNFEMANAFFGDFDGDGIPDLSFGHEPESGVDFGYDADVVYHEFGHALVGELAGGLPFLQADEHGMQWVAGSVNEGAADIFSMLLTLDPRVGEYAGSGFGRDAIRDLAAPRRCPDDLRGEVHRDGEVLGSFGWRLIADPRVGVDITGELLVGAIPLWGPDLTWKSVGASLEQTAADLLDAGAIDASAHAAILEHLGASGMADCGRVISLDDGLKPDLYLVTGGFVGEMARIPAGTQLSLDVPEDAAGVRIHVRDFSGPDGMGWTLSGRVGEPVAHEVTEVAALGLAVSVPVTFDWQVDGEAEQADLLLTPTSDPPLVPGSTLYLAPASVNLGALVPFEFAFGRATVSAEIVHAPGFEPAQPRGCATAPGAPGALLLLVLLAVARRPG